LIVIGVAQRARPLGHAVEAGDQRLRRECETGQSGFDTDPEGRDIIGIVEIGRQGRSAGCQRIRRRQAKASSLAVAVVAAQYCG
jgi:hypothetical protein